MSRGAEREASPRRSPLGRTSLTSSYMGLPDAVIRGRGSLRRAGVRTRCAKPRNTISGAVCPRSCSAVSRDTRRNSRATYSLTAGRKALRGRAHFPVFLHWFWRGAGVGGPMYGLTAPRSVRSSPAIGKIQTITTSESQLVVRGFRKCPMSASDSEKVPNDS